MIRVPALSNPPDQKWNDFLHNRALDLHEQRADEQYRRNIEKYVEKYVHPKEFNISINLKQFIQEQQK